MDELLDTMYARAIAKFKESDTGNLLGATDHTTVQPDTLLPAMVENISAGIPININLPAQYGGINPDNRVEFSGNHTTPMEQVDVTNLIFTLKTGEFLYVLDPRVNRTKGKVYIAVDSAAAE